jgi:hypothetical protein
MAVWEYRCTIVPAASIGLLDPLSGETLSRLDSLGIWQNVQVAKLLQFFPASLKCSKGWTENLTILEFGESCRVEIYAEAGSVLDVQVFFDLRYKFMESVQALLDVCVTNRWVLLDEEPRMLSAHFDSVIASILSSPAAEFVADPKGFLVRHGRSAAPP